MGVRQKMNRETCIMVVDDDQELLKLLPSIFEPEGYRTVTAHDGCSALALLDEHKPDLIILDIIMPGLDGLQLLDIVRQRSEVPVIMLTGKCEVSFLREALVAGADDYLKKPFSTVELLARIRAKLRRARQDAT